MSQQHDDDEGTVIRPAAAASAFAPAVTAGRPSDAAPPDGAEDVLSLRIGSRLSEFEITQRIGDGGFSIVYLAMDHSLGRVVALKEYMPSSLATRVGSTQVQPRAQRYRDTFEAGLKSFVNEAKLLARFDHPSLVKVYRFWEANGTAYMVMPFYQGVTVKDAVRAMPAPPDEAWLLTLLAPLTEALMVIHAEHCYHRDIAPDNVILLAGSAKPLLLDFGAARRVIGDMTQGLTVILKAGYAPVEQYAEIPGMKQGPWTDVYALAAVVYWAITGSTPPASVGRMMSDSFVPLTECAAGRYSPRFLQTIDRALVVLPERRTQTIGMLRSELGLTGEDPPEPATPLPWNDSDATVIRPIRPAPARRDPDEPSDRPTAQHATAAPAAQHTAAPDALAAADAPQVGTRRMMLAGSALGALAAAAGVWWLLAKPGTEPPRPAPQDAGAGAPAPLPAAAPAATEAAQPALPAVTQPTLAPTPDTTAAPPPVAATPAPQPVTDAPLAPVDPPREAPPATSPAKKAAPAETAAAPPAQGDERISPRRDATPREPAAADTANRAECARIIQRLSLGESSPELLDRLKSLKCR